MVAVTQDKKQYDQENDSTDNLTKKMRNQCLPFLFEIEIPNVAINQRDNQRRAQQNCCCTNMPTPRCMDSVHNDGGVNASAKEKSRNTSPSRTPARRFKNRPT